MSRRRGSRRSVVRPFEALKHWIWSPALPSSCSSALRGFLSRPYACRASVFLASTHADTFRNLHTARSRVHPFPIYCLVARLQRRCNAVELRTSVARRTLTSSPALRGQGVAFAIAVSLQQSPLNVSVRRADEDEDVRLIPHHIRMNCQLERHNSAIDPRSPRRQMGVVSRIASLP